MPPYSLLHIRAIRKSTVKRRGKYGISQRKVRLIAVPPLQNRALCSHNNALATRMFPILPDFARKKPLFDAASHPRPPP